MFVIQIPTVSEVNYKVICNDMQIAGDYIIVPTESLNLGNYDLKVTFDSNVLHGEATCKLLISNTKEEKKLDFEVIICVEPKGSFH